MTIGRLTAQKYRLAEMMPIIDALVQHVRVTCQPEAIYLIGSAVRDEYTDYSDIDFVVVVADDDHAAAARRSLHLERPHREIPVDFNVVSRHQFDQRADIGGIAFEAKHHGKLLYAKETS